MPCSSVFVASNFITAFELKVIKHIKSSFDNVEVTVFKECFTRDNLVKLASSFPFNSLLADDNIEPDTSIKEIKRIGFLDSIFFGVIVIFTKTSLSFWGFSITSVLNDSISGFEFLSIFAVFVGISGIFPIFKKFSIRLFKA